MLDLGYKPLSADRPFSVLYADPPWSFEVWSPKGEDRAPQQHYPCMPLQQICDLTIGNLPVSRLAARDALLFLWVYQPMLPEALSVIRAWGFDYRTIGYYWVKTRAPSLNQGVDPFPIGLGHYTRAGAEQCWIARRGKGLTRLSRSERQVIFAPLREHSRKPDEVADSIVRLTGDVPRLELFARESRPGWSVWGNETRRFDDRVSPMKTLP